METIDSSEMTPAGEGLIPMPHMDVAANRASSAFTRAENLRRLLWACVWPLFRLSPRPLYGWRRWLLRRLGARIGAHVNIHNTAQIALPWNLCVGDWSCIGDAARIYNLGPITIGSRVTVSQHAHLCAGTHDYTLADMPLRKPPIRIEDDAWVCADAFVAGGITIHQGAVVGARAVVVKDVPAWSVVAGNPARVVKQRILRPPLGSERHGASRRWLESECRELRVES